jgi:C-methyltransferase
MRLISEAIPVVATLGIADLLTAPRTADELAKATGAAADPLRRVMRALASFEVFSQDFGGRYTLGPLGESLKRDVTGSLHGAALFFGGETGTNLIRLFLDSVRTGESAVQKLAGGKRIFEWLQNDPERTQLFNSVMTSLANLQITGLLEAYDFSYARKLVDVGGGHGKNLAHILIKNPGMRGVLFDLPHAYEGGPKLNTEPCIAPRALN